MAKTDIIVNIDKDAIIDEWLRRWPKLLEHPKVKAYYASKWKTIEDKIDEQFKL